jgi:hypothetical protein
MKNPTMLLILSFILGATTVKVADSPFGKPVACLRHAILPIESSSGCNECKERLSRWTTQKLERWWSCVRGVEEAVI